MQRKLYFILSTIISIACIAQSPHGSNLRMDCAACHSAQGWTINRDSMHWSHDSTRFGLTGKHTQVDCRACHSDLVFEKTNSACISCHKDMHSNTVGTDCARCHTTNNWVIENKLRLHEKASFPLLGNHATADCNECHKSNSLLRFDRIGKECITCHQDDYAKKDVVDHARAGFGTDCAQCHQVQGKEWVANYPHDFFPLTKGHEIESCNKCHTNGSYQSASSDCKSCHLRTYLQSSNPDHKKLDLSTDCSSCHTTDVSWQPAKFDQHNTIFRLEGNHKVIANDCAACHKGNYTGSTPTDCYGCHKTDYDATVTVRHKERNVPTKCEACHSQSAWSPVIQFDHNTTRFPLTGAHEVANCIHCHLKGFSGTPTMCVDCHLENFNTAKSPDHKKLGLSNDCSGCHTTNPDWAPAKFIDHNTVFKLEGNHTSVSCESCHKGNYTGNTPKTCVGCHLTNYNSTTNPNHKASNFPTACESCHAQTAWSPATFDHAKTKFLLTGAHTSVACLQCHTKGYTGTSTNCVDCHLTNFNASVNPNHKTLNLSTDCKQCHTTNPDWTPATFTNHNAIYKIEGAHTSIANDCAACHKGVYNGTTPKTCVGCHQADYNATKDPDHAASKFPTDCASCHMQTSWLTSNFDHAKTKFPLTGAHTSVACLQCHTKGYTGTSTNCVDCHLTNFNASVNPNHKTLNLSTDCKQCHTTNPDWTPATFSNHNTIYKIEGAHTSIANDCAACHKGVYNGTTPKTCVGCHQADYNATKDPDHAASKFPTDCASCHVQTSWLTSNFDHAKTKFPLTGAHTSVACLQCHTKGYTGTSTNCVDCHLTNFNASVNPNHKTLNLSTDCKQCHTTNPDWTPATFSNHNAIYKIEGAHTSIANDCAACHKGVYNGTTPKTCVGCHQADYNATKDPDHAASKFPTDCASCHVQTSWLTSNFDHAKTKFPLTGAHTSVACLQCHTKGYTGTSTNCVDCHLTKFNASVNPNHKTLNLSTDCKQCHTTNPDWTPATFTNHNTIYKIEGAHISIANDCAACHKGVYNGTTPKTCVGCHQAEYYATKDPDHAASKFPTDCASCHMQTSWLSSNFDHAKTKFPLTGAHTSVACLQCHTKGYTGTSTNCVDCHLTNFNASVNPNHKTLNLSTDCKQCHTTNPDWTPATFSNHNAIYKIEGAHTSIANDCAACHKGVYNGTTPKTCVGCHQADYYATKDPDHAASKFPTDCASCHVQTSWLTSNFDHAKTKFPLTGAHTSVACLQCHTKGYTGTSTNCVDCHLTNFNASVNPNHKTLNLSTDCKQCHTTNPDWTPATFSNHNAIYKIEGAHTSIANDCAACHKGVYNGTTPKTCVGCHQADYYATKDPDHAASKFPTDCASCHMQTSWLSSNFDHAKTKFPLTGAHTSVACLQCHTKGYTGTSTNCVDCHLTNFNASVNPNHKTLNLSTDCKQCHTTNPDWTPATFTNHNTIYKIEGAHISIANDCAACHKGVYNGSTPKTCVGCHQADYYATKDPDHAASKFPTDCASCHVQTSWLTSNFDHAKTKFPLTGAHTSVACLQCHTKGYTGTSTNCVDCHLTNFNASVNPNHKTLNLSTDCKQCHTTNPDWTPATFSNHNAIYKIEGAHTSIANDCAACHKGVYNGTTPKTCVGCHQADYYATKDPDHAASKFPTDCASCHMQTSWLSSNFDHAKTKFPLTGAHTSVACLQCHTKGYTGTSTNCVDCHLTNFNASVNPNHKTLNLSTDCKQCHTTNPDWTPATFTNHNTIYKIEGAHISIANDCAACHKGVYNGSTPKTCVGCHHSNYNAATNPNHTAGNYPTTCEQCHSQTAWAPATLDHNKTKFPLTGAHTTVSCAQCHTKVYTGTSTVCVDCHLSKFNATTNPNHKTAGISTDCKVCHTTAPGWTPATFANHNTYYTITGAHTAVSCAACHKGIYNGTTPKTCVGCHLSNYNATTNPNHKAGNYPTSCEQCHSQTAWALATVDHNKTKFPLTGAHTTVSCAQCHTKGYTGTSTVCVDCHLTKFNATTNPNHKTLGISTDCKVCHTTAPGWTPATFANHNTYYTITGAHTAVSCAACHKGIYNGTTPKTCVGCHLSNYNATTNPNHKAGNYPTACEQCHSQTAWAPATVDHNKTKFPLTGAHTTVSCAQCHTKGYTGTSTVCVDCHLSKFNATTNPNHKTAGISTDCKLCHTTAPGWTPATFANHNTYYTISGAHTAVSCAACHKGIYNGTTPKTCVGCHLSNYNATTKPNHKAGNYPTACEQCHSQTAWAPATIDHNKTKFPLTGAHTTVSCAQCHTKGYTGTSTVCVDCHLSKFNATTNPNHKTAGISTDCKVCHTTAPGWTPATFANHNTYYTITGAHTAVSCAACHKGIYNGTTPKTCVGCHLSNYNATTKPNHKAGNYPTACEQCHSQTAWAPATVDHNKTKFPLTGAHTTVSCAQCHTKGYTGTSTVCVDCHLSKFNATTNPNHKTAGISTDCKLCHTTAPGWTPATFANHNTYYTISGAHTAVSCAACHKGIYNGTTPKTCVGCHLSNYNATTKPNHKAGNYPTACEQCHSQTAWAPATIDHNKTKFPLTGAHTTVSCAQCHTKGYTGTSTVCVDCHLSKFNATTNPNHKTAGISTDCKVCHTTAPGWTPATFANHNTYYTITGAHTAVSCAACHKGIYNGTTPKTCVGCHLSNYNATTNPNHLKAGFPKTCESCHSQTAWAPSTFNHDATYFPIYSGKHKGKWTLCSECHTNASNFTVFTCINCHEHNNSKDMADKHKKVNSYTYSPTSCYGCHPKGVE